MKIHFIVPWSTEKNIGRAYNESMEIVSENDWVCFIDGDAINTTTYFGLNIEKVINENSNYSLFTCYTNRVIRKYQIPECDWKNNNIEYHRQIGHNLWDKNGTLVMDITNLKPLSGVMILISKKTWKSIGKFTENRMLGIDNDIHKKVRQNGLRVGLMKGIYLYHWYRNGNINNKEHLL